MRHSFSKYIILVLLNIIPSISIAAGWSYQNVNDGYNFSAVDAEFNEKGWISINYLPQLDCKPYMTVRISPEKGLDTSLYYKDQLYQIKIDDNPLQEKSEFIVSFTESFTGGKLPRIDFKVFLSSKLIEQIKKGSKLQHFYQAEDLGVVTLKGSRAVIEESESICENYLKSGEWKAVTFGSINGEEWDERVVILDGEIYDSEKYPDEKWCADADYQKHMDMMLAYANKYKGVSSEYSRLWNSQYEFESAYHEYCSSEQVDLRIVSYFKSEYDLKSIKKITGELRDGDKSYIEKAFESYKRILK